MGNRASEELGVTHAKLTQYQASAQSTIPGRGLIASVSGLSTAAVAALLLRPLPLPQVLLVVVMLCRSAEEAFHIYVEAFFHTVDRR